MDKETIKRLYAETTGFDIEFWHDSDIALVDFAQACCNWQKEKDAQICEAIPEYCIPYECAEAIRNSKESPETDIDRATRLI
jgi:hypothetical protein